ncbi:MAG TPA: hypothetical protein VGS97_20245 [Actinocrinis sp.]|uniref:hypothetical protein n=1 Tax=Actinocrinis sp. TaxID=1920516 RepID=UPI002DDD66F4|nr:hypothetical protein [Actinocrinis sp.]HEV2346441.1 hypothetical protein [Actinocrinis sp.]
MTTTYTIFQVLNGTAILRGAEQPVWMVSYIRSDTGLAHTHGFPHEIFVNLCAEYEHDPHDIDTLIQLVLHQPHMDIQHTDDDFVYKATIEQARAGHLAKLAKSQQDHVYVDEGNHLDAIRQQHDPADPRIAPRCEKVRQVRRNHRRNLGLA